MDQRNPRENNEPQQPPLVLLSRKGQITSRPTTNASFTSKLNPAAPEFVPGRPSSLGSASGSAVQQPPVEPKKPPNASLIFVNDESEIVDFISKHLYDDNQHYTVIGAIGLQGSGKSTLLSMLAGNSPHDKYRQYIFRPCSRETIYSGLFQTNGIHIYVTESRMIYIDTKPFLCSAVFEEHIRRIKSESSSLAVLKSTQIEGLTFLSFLFEVCDTIMFTIDWFIDLNAVQEVLRAALFSEFNFRKFAGYPKTTNLVIAHQRAKPTDFEMLTVKKRARMIRSMFRDSGYDVTGGISMANLGFTEYVNCEPDVNYIVFDDLPQWAKDYGNEGRPLRISYENVLYRLRPALLGLKKYNFRHMDKLRPLRRRTRNQKSYLPPTLDGKKAAQLKEAERAEKSPPPPKRPPDEQERNGAFAADDEKPRLDFNPDHMPNITKWQYTGDVPREPWNEQQQVAALSVLSPPESDAEALKSLSLLLATHCRRKRDEYVETLIPPVDQARLSERQWFEYARKVLDTTKKAYTNKYFVSNNGRLVPRLIRKLKDATRVLHAEPKRRTRQPRAAAKQQPLIIENSTKKAESLAESLGELRLHTRKRDTAAAADEEEHEIKTATTMGESGSHIPDANKEQNESHKRGGDYRPRKHEPAADERVSASEFDESFSGGEEEEEDSDDLLGSSSEDEEETTSSSGDESAVAAKGARRMVRRRRNITDNDEEAEDESDDDDDY